MSTRSTISLITALLLLLAQLSTVVHAAEHPFHDHDVQCENFIATEKHDSADIASASTTASAIVRTDIFISTGRTAHASAFTAYPARAPPAPVLKRI